MAEDIISRVLRFHAEQYITRKLKKQSINQAINQPINQPKQSIKQSKKQVNQSINQSGHEMTVESINQTINRQKLYLLPGSNHQSINQSIECMLEFLQLV